MADKYNYQFSFQHDGSADGNDEDNFFTYVVDPNPVGRTMVDTEDLFIFCRLRAFLKNRSVVSTDNVYTSNNRVQDGVYFIASMKQNGKSYATTSYTNIGGQNQKGTEEGLGIRDIEITTKMATPPTVVINFVDVRGSGVFDRYEYEVGGGDGTEAEYYNSSIYNLFFYIPAPIFELTVKGYYGKAVTYYLNLISFSASFEPESGDFLIRCEFISYQFSFLSDLILDYIMAINRTSKASALLSQYIKKDGTPGLLTIPELLKKYTQINELVSEFSKTPQAIELKFLVEYISQVNFLQSDIGRLNTNIQSIQKNTLGDVSDLESKVYAFYENVGIFQYNPNDNYIIKYVNLINEKINAINKFFELNNIQSLSNLKLNNFYPDYGAPMKIDGQVIQKIEDIIKRTSNQLPLLITDQDLKNELGDIDVIVIDFYSLRDEVINKLENARDIQKDQLKITSGELQNSYLQLVGFNPTIYNVFEIIFGNVDVFLDIFHDVSSQANSLGKIRVGDMRNFFENKTLFSDVDVSNPPQIEKIFPFPAVYNEEGEHAWLGDIVGESNPNFPELKMVEDIIKGKLEISEEISKLEEIGDFTNVPPTITNRWFPISPIDFTNNVLANANNFNYDATTNYSELYNKIVERGLYIYYVLSLSAPNKSRLSKISEFAKLEATYFLSNIQNNEILTLLANISKDQFISLASNALADNLFTSPNVDLTNVSKKIGVLFNKTLTDGVDHFEGGVLLNSSELSTFDSFKGNPLSEITKKYIESNSINLKNLYYNPDLIDNDNYYFDPIGFLYVDLTADCYEKSLSRSIKTIYNQSLPTSNGQKERNNAPYINSIKTLRFFDNLRNKQDNDNLDYNTVPYQRNLIGRVPSSNSLFSNKVYILDASYYKESTTTKELKAYIFLNSLGYENITVSSLFLKRALYGQNRTILMFNTMFLAYIGSGLYYEKNVSLLNNINSDIKSIYFSQVRNLRNFFVNNANLENFLIKQFEDFVKTYGDIEKYLNSYRPKTNNEKYTNDELADIGKLLEKIKGIAYIYNYGSANFSVIPNLKTTPIVKSEFINLYLTPFYDLINNYTKQLVQSGQLGQTPTKNDGYQNSVIEDRNIKIRIYNDLKAVYDKWISFSDRSGRVYNYPSNLTQNPNTMERLIDHCYFIDRLWRDIGDIAVLNPTSIMNQIGVTDGSVYNFMSRVLQNNKFLLFNLPCYINYGDAEEVLTMFKPFTTIENANVTSNFIFQYAGGESKLLDIRDHNRLNYVNDSFDLKGSKNGTVIIPKRVRERKKITVSPALTGNLKNLYLSKFNLSMFRVSYADQNQNIFTKINVSMTDTRETGESVMALTKLFGSAGGTRRLFTGSDLYNVYSLRAYKTSVECMGNMTITPTQLFQLDNIPLFHGAHTIQEVTHSISPNNVVTKFTGSRVSKYIYPIVDNIIAFIKPILLDNIVLKYDIGQQPIPDSNGVDSNIIFTPSNQQTASGNVVNIPSGTTRSISNTTGQSSFSPVSPQNNQPIVLPANREVFSVTKTDSTNNSTDIFSYRLRQSVSLSILQNRIDNLFIGSQTKTFGLVAGECAKWCRIALEELGIFRNLLKGNPSTGVDAWEWFMGIPENQFIGYFRNEDKLTGWTNQEFLRYGVPNGSLLWGYLTTSSSKNKAYNRMKKFNNRDNRINILKSLSRRKPDNSFDFPPTTHICIFIKGQVYDLLSFKKRPAVLGIPSKNFVPIAYYHFLPVLEKIASSTA